MSNKPLENVRNTTEPDPRVARSTSALGRALIELIQERDLREITVQAILDRAGVGRTTFYAHYRNKEDVLHSSFEHLFAAFEEWLERRPTAARLFPVEEFLSHLSDQQRLSESLRRSGQADEFWSLCGAHAAKSIERRLHSIPDDSPVSRQLRARMLAGALMESISWWDEHPKAATPAQVDSAFHELARGVMSFQVPDARSRGTS
jgi:AcrR family transcriptional regulator